MKSAAPPKIAVLPNVLGAIGLRHPIDGPLDRDGSAWTHDVFTNRKLMDGSIRRKEVDAATTPTGVAVAQIAKVTTSRPKIATR